MAAKHSTPIVKLQNTQIGAKRREVFSLNGACDDTHSFIYLGLHGAAEVIEISDADLESLEELVKELRHARSVPSRR